MPVRRGMTPRTLGDDADPGAQFYVMHDHAPGAGSAQDVAGDDFQQCLRIRAGKHDGGVFPAV